MIESLSQTQSKLYPRAIDPALEGHMRARNTEEKLPSPPPSETQNRLPRAEADAQRLSQYEQATQQSNSGEQRAHEVAEQLSQSVRQAKQTSAKHKSTFSLTSTTGQRANQSYLTAGQPKEMHLVDELT